MIYLQKSRPAKSKKFLLTILLAVVIVLGFLSLQIFAGGMVARLAMKTGGPIAATYLAVKNKIVYTGQLFSSRASLIRENQELKNRIEDNQAALTRFDSLFAEHEELLKNYGRKISNEAFVLGNVISKPPRSPYDVILVDTGTNHGVVIGSRVYGWGGLPLGRVSEVSASKAKIVMFSSPGEESQVVHERTGTAMNVLGTGGGNLEAEVAQEMDVLVGDTILLPQFGGAVIATVVEIESNVTSAFKRVLLKVPVNIFNLRWVEIAKSGEVSLIEYP